MQFFSDKRKSRLYSEFLVNLGRNTEVVLQSGRRIAGRIEAVDREAVALNSQGRSSQVPYADIASALFGTPGGMVEVEREASQAPVADPKAAVHSKPGKVGRNSLYARTIKSTLQLPEPALHRLDEIIPEMRRHLPQRQRSLVTKGAIIDILTEFGLEDLRRSKSSSVLVTRLHRKASRN